MNETRENLIQGTTYIIHAPSFTDVSDTRMYFYIGVFNGNKNGFLIFTNFGRVSLEMKKRTEPAKKSVKHVFFRSEFYIL